MFEDVHKTFQRTAVPADPTESRVERAAQTLNGRAARGVTDAHSRSRLSCAAGAHAYSPASTSHTSAALCKHVRRHARPRRLAAPKKKTKSVRSSAQIAHTSPRRADRRCSMSFSHLSGAHSSVATSRWIGGVEATRLCHEPLIFPCALSFPPSHLASSGAAKTLGNYHFPSCAARFCTCYFPAVVGGPLAIRA